MKIPLTALTLIVWLTACVSLKQVGQYSAQATDGIAQFEELEYSFERHCLDRCLFNAMTTFEIKRELACSCDDYQEADSVTSLIYHAIAGYFSGLNDLSLNELTAYDLGPFRSTLTAGNFGDININAPQAEAYTSLTQLLLRAATGAFRNKKIKDYIETANAPLQVLLEKFRFILQQNLVNALDFRKERYFAYYREMNLGGNNTTYERGKATIDYYTELASISRKQKQIDAFATTLQTIGEGHQELYDNRNKLKAKELATGLRGYANSIRDLVSQFNQLKNN